MSDIERLSGLRVGFAVCGSFCTFEKAFKALEELTELGCEITPIMSFNAYSLDTRFGTAQKNAARMFEITGKTVLHDITSTEPVGPKKMFDVLVVVKGFFKTDERRAVVAQFPIAKGERAVGSCRLIDIAIVLENVERTLGKITGQQTVGHVVAVDIADAQFVAVDEA